jgi:hypothetical protein
MAAAANRDDHDRMHPETTELSNATMQDQENADARELRHQERLGWFLLTSIFVGLAVLVFLASFV